MSSQKTMKAMDLTRSLGSQMDLASVGETRRDVDRKIKRKIRMFLLAICCG